MNTPMMASPTRRPRLGRYWRAGRGVPSGWLGVVPCMVCTSLWSSDDGLAQPTRVTPAGRVDGAPPPPGWAGPPRRAGPGGPDQAGVVGQDHRLDAVAPAELAQQAGQ